MTISIADISEKKKDFLITAGILILALAVRIIQLGQFLTADEPRAWYGRSIQFMQAIIEGRLGDTFFSYTPGVTLTWFSGTGLYLAYLFKSAQNPGFATFLQELPFDPMSPDMVYWFQLPNIIVGAICIAVVYFLAKRLLGFKIALVGSLLIALDPLVIGMTRVVSNDGAAASFITGSVLAMILFFTKNRNILSYKMLVFSAIWAGFAVLSKFTAFFLLPFFGLLIIVTTFYFNDWRRLPKYIVPGLIWAAVTLLTIIIFWPALWIYPMDSLQEIYTDLNTAVGEAHNRGSFFLGTPVPDPGVWFYWVAVYFRLTAIAVIGLFFSTFYLFARKTKDLPKKLDIVLMFLFIILYIIFLSTGGKKQDRYIVPVLPIAALIAATGYVWITGKFKNRAWQTTFLTVVIVLQAAIAISYSPYYLSHYNLLAGGSKTAPDMILIGWGEGLDQAAAYLNSMPDAKNVKAASWYHSTFEPYFHGQAVETAGNEKMSRSPKPALVADYVVLYVNQIQRQMPTPGMIQFYQSFKPEKIITINGIDYAFIYPSPAMQHAFSGEVRLVGQAELLGYTLLDTEEQPIAEIPADATTIVRLYWEWQGKTPNEEIKLDLVDFNGRVWGHAESLGSFAPLPFSERAEGAIAHDEFALRLLPGTPPGHYYLKAWIDRPATNERVGDFPLLLEDVQLTVSRPASPPPVSELPLTEHLNQLHLNGAATLLGFDDTDAMTQPWQPGESRDLTLYWQANEAISQNHPVTLALVDTNGTVRVEWSNVPAGGYFPTGQWQPNDIIRDPWTLPLPAYVPSGNYQLTVQLGEGSPKSLSFVPIEGRPRQFDAPSLDIVLNQTFGNSIKLLGLAAPTTKQTSVEIAPGQPLNLALIWQADNLIDADYTITVQLLDAQQQVHAQRDNMPLDGAAPTTSWAVGEVIPDNITLDIPQQVGSGPHNLLIALYRTETGERLILPDGADHLKIPVESMNN